MAGMRTIFNASTSGKSALPGDSGCMHFEGQGARCRIAVTKFGPNQTCRDIEEALLLLMQQYKTVAFEELLARLWDPYAGGRNWLIIKTGSESGGPRLFIFVHIRARAGIFHGVLNWPEFYIQHYIADPAYISMLEGANTAAERTRIACAMTVQDFFLENTAPHDCGNREITIEIARDTAIAQLIELSIDVFQRFDYVPTVSTWLDTVQSLRGGASI